VNARGRSAAALTAAGLAIALSACAPAVALEPAPEAASPACADVSVRLPDEIGGLAERETTAQATGAWGQPTAIVLHCGAPPPAPTSTLPCYTVGEVDWLVDDADDPTFLFTSYGRTPAVTVAVDNTAVAGITVLESLSAAVAQLPSTGACLALEDLGEIPSVDDEVTAG